MSTVEKELVKFSHGTDSSLLREHLVKVHKMCVDLAKRLAHMRREVST
jgi:hypothetical protein